MYKDKKLTAIILIAGNGKRFLSYLPKQFHMLSGKKIYLHTLEPFLKLNIFDKIILVCQKKYLNMIKKDTENIKNIKIVLGGETRQISVYNALLKCKESNLVSIHDGVRPFVKENIIIQGIEKAIIHGASNTCIETFDTIVERDKKNFIKTIPKRKYLLRGQTPQTFKYDLLLDAHKNAKREDATDDCSLIINQGKPVHIVKGDLDNIKITTNMDLFLAEQLLRTRINKVKKGKRDLKGKKYVVVGGSGGIGREILKLLKKEKAVTISLSRSTKNLSLDLKDPKSIKRAFDTIYKKYGKIDGLINAAGVLIRSPLNNLSEKDIKDLISINLTGLILCCKKAKIKDLGHIINISSSSYARGRENISIYSSTKAAVVNFTQALSEELSSLKVNSVVPQRTDTDLRRNNFKNEKKETLLSPTFVAERILDILKDDKTTGSIIEIRKTPNKPE